jgi:flavin-dependent dehydrogenase
VEREPRQLAADVIIVGAGHNGLVAALLLARRGLDVLVLEEQKVIGGGPRNPPAPLDPSGPFATLPTSPLPRAHICSG